MADPDLPQVDYRALMAEIQRRNALPEGERPPAGTVFLVNAPPAGDEQRLIDVLIDLILSTCVHEVPHDKR